MSDDSSSATPKPLADAPPPSQASAPAANPAAHGSGFDGWIRSNPWHPRIAPFFCWIIFLAITGFLPESLAPAQPLIYTLQCVATVWLLWTYRKLTPELTLRFHWLAIPTGVFLLIAWVVLAYAMAGELGYRWQQFTAGSLKGAFGPFPYAELGLTPGRFGPELDAAGQVLPHDTQLLIQSHPALGYLSLGLRLLGMSLIVPLFEELFIRSAMLRGLQRPGPTFRGLLQFASDLPVVGDAIARSKAGQQANAQPSQLTAQLESVPVGMISVFAIAASTFVFMLSHAIRDWPGCIACGVVWCLLLWWVNRPRPAKGETWESIRIRPGWADDSASNRGRLGLGPVSWSHGITNALLWGYTLAWNDWRFL